MFLRLPRSRLVALSLLTIAAALPAQAVETADPIPLIPLNSLSIPDRDGDLAEFGDIARAIAGVNGRNGFRIDGVAAGDASGISVAGAGDVNGDGLADLLIGASRASPGGKQAAGASYVVFGRAAGFVGNVSLGALNGRNGFRLDGAAPGDASGISVAGAGDVNGDGFDDVIIGAQGADPEGKLGTGSSYVVFGRATGFASIVKLSGLNGTAGFRLDGAQAGEASGSSVAAAGDVNGDGLADLIIGAPGSRHEAGSSYVVFGRKSGLDARFSLAGLNGRNGFRLDGAHVGERSGTRVAGAGDVNGDGLADVIVAAPEDRNSVGSSYVVFGKARGFAASIDLSRLGRAAGFLLREKTADDHWGGPAAVAGDVNGDGNSDLIAGAPQADPGGRKNAGSSYVIFGRGNWSVNPGKISVNEDQGTVSFTVSRKAVAKAETVYVSTTEGEGFSNRQDYSGINGEALHFAAGQKSKQVSVEINDDSRKEADEAFGFIVQRHAGEARGKHVAKASFTIRNDDTAEGGGRAVAAAPVTIAITSALDTYVRQASATTAFGTAAIVNADSSDGGGAVHGLLYFNVIGSGANQVPAGATINSASLILRTTDGGNGGTFYRMLQNWGETSTWQSLTNGIQTDNIEARSTADFATGAMVIGTSTFDVTSSVAAWAAGQANFGWAIIPLGTNGWDFSSRQGLTAPSLSVTYTASGGPLPPTASLTANPTTINAGSSTTLAWSSTNATSCTGTNFSTGGATSGSVADVPAASTTYSVACSGDGGTANASASVTVQPGGGSTPINVRVAASADDAEESSAGAVNLTSSDLELVLDTTAQTVGMRFANIALPQGASITNAYVQFTVDEVSTAAASLTIQGVAADSATAFTTAASNVSSRPRTGASVQWIPAGWPAIDAVGVDQRTPNLAPVIQEIVNRAGWTSGNALSIIVRGSGKRVARAFDISAGAKAPLLHIEYTTTPDNAAPSVPTNLAGTAVSSSRINLNWTASTDNFAVTGYKVFRDGGAAPIATVTGTSYSDIGLSTNTTYSYAVSAFDAAGNSSAQSFPAVQVTTQASDTAAPSVPADLIGTAVSSSRINLTWTASTDNVAVTGYKVFRNGSAIPIATVTASSYADIGLLANTTYSYTVSAFDAAGNNSAESAPPVQVTTQATDTAAPSVPAGLGGTAVSSTQINLSWTSSTDNVAVTGYKVFRNGVQVGTPASNSFSDTGLAASTSYSYAVSAFDAAGNNSAQSTPAVQVTTQASTGTIRVPEDFATIQAAINAAVNGNTVLVAPGTYTGGITITGKTITLASYFHTTGDPSYINTTTISGGTIGVNIAATSPNVIVKGLRFTGGSDSLVLRAPGGQSISNFFDHTGLDALSFEQIGGIARDNICIGAGDDCIDADVPTTDLLIENNVLETPKDDGIELRMEPLNAPPLPPLPNLVTVTIRGNKITSVDDDGIQLIDSPGIQNRRFVIERNLIRNSGKVGLGLMDNGVTVEDYRAASMPERIHVFNNTFDGNNYGITGGDNLIAVNNIISRSRTLGLKNIDAASIVSNTLFWNNAQDQVGSNMDLATTISGDPRYTASFGLGAGSPAIDAGTATFTHNGETVLTIPPSTYTGSAPDLGPYESGP